jgi:hypothetical protein
MSQWFDATRAFRNMGGDWSFTKLLIVAFFVAHWYGHAPGVIAEALLMSAAFGKSTFEAWLQRGTWTASDSTVTQNITERRTVDHGIGVEPA